MLKFFSHFSALYFKDSKFLEPLAPFLEVVDIYVHPYRKGPIWSVTVFKLQPIFHMRSKKLIFEICGILVGETIPHSFPIY